MKSQKMYIIVFGVFIIKAEDRVLWERPLCSNGLREAELIEVLQISVSEPQFPSHIDLQKVGEAIFNNEKFNILKPTTHQVTDHFKEFMLRTESSYHPAKRVFIDNNGFRHDWSGFGEKTKSLRKTDLKKVRGSFENTLENTPESDIISKEDNDNATATVEENNVSNTENENNNQQVENNASDNNNTVQNLTEEDPDTPESKETTTILNLSNITIIKKLRQGKDNAKAKPAKKADPEKKADTKKQAKTTKKNTATKKPDDGKKDAKDKKDDSKKDKKTGSDDKAKKGKAEEKSSKAKEEKTVIRTTFFCPYFGTITMSSFVD